MSAVPDLFQPGRSLVPGLARPGCRACITVPARNEAESLGRCLDAFAAQVQSDGTPMSADSYEVLLLLNNCQDDSAGVAYRWQKDHAGIALHVVESTLPAECAHVGTARRLLMDTAWARLGGSSAKEAVILTTDADTVVARDWLAQNLRSLQNGADAVGGFVCVRPDELAGLPEKVRRCYEQDRLYAHRVAQLEALLDPCAGDPWPRHLDHFGSSLACTRETYAAVGGMPAVSPLEDEAFIDRIRRAGLILRHEPRVAVWTSARLEGRATVGLAGQFRLWSTLPDAEAHLVQSAAFLEHRFRSLRRLRRVFLTKDAGAMELPPEWWKNTFRDALECEHTCPGFLAAVYCDVLIAESFEGSREETIAQAVAALHRRIVSLQKAADRRVSLHALPGATGLQSREEVPEFVQ